jgi:hypothetical protein
MHAIARLQFWFMDRDGNMGAVQWYIPSSLDPESVLENAIALALPRIQACVDSAFDHVVVEYRSSPGASSSPGATSNIHRKALLIFSNADSELDALSIPSPVATLYETSGIYAGMRVDAGQLADLVNMLDSILFRTKDDRPFGSVFVAGSLAY